SLPTRRTSLRRCIKSPRGIALRRQLRRALPARGCDSESHPVKRIYDSVGPFKLASGDTCGPLAQAGIRIEQYPDFHILALPLFRRPGRVYLLPAWSVRARNRCRLLPENSPYLGFLHSELQLSEMAHRHAVPRGKAKRDGAKSRTKQPYEQQSKSRPVP